MKQDKDDKLKTRKTRPRLRRQDQGEEEIISEKNELGIKGRPKTVGVSSPMPTCTPYVIAHKVLDYFVLTACR